MAIAFRPLVSDCSMKSRYGSQALADGFEAWLAVSESVDTSMAGFEVSPVFPVQSGVVPAAGSVDTCMAGFGRLRPQLPGGRTSIPAARRYPAAVSRRTPVAFSIRRSVQPNRPSAKICCRLSSLKTLLT